MTGLLLSLFLLAAVQSRAEATNTSERAVSLMGSHGVRLNAQGKLFDYTCRLKMINVSELPTGGHSLAVLFIVEQGPAKGRKIHFMRNDPRLQELASRFVSQTTTNIRMRLVLTGELIDDAYFSPENDIIKSIQAIDEGEASAQQSAPANGASPRR